MELSIPKSLIMKPIIFQDIYIEVLDFFQTTHPTNWEYPPHKHPWYEFNLVQHGEIYTTIFDTEFKVSSGQCMLMSPSLIHSHRHCNFSGDSGICMRFYMRKTDENLGVFDRLSEALKAPKPFAFSTDLTPLLTPGHGHLYEAEFIRWIFSMYDMWCDDKNKTVHHAKSLLSAQIILYLSEYYMNKIYVSDIARALNVSYRTLARTFKKETGVSIIEKLSEIRINEAKRLLLSTDYTMLTIANKVGFENEYYFSLAFKKHAKVSPSEFKKRATPVKPSV